MKNANSNHNSPVTKGDLETAVAQIAETIVKYCASKDDLKKTEERLGTRIDKVENRLGKVESDAKDIKRQLTDLRADTPTPQELADHEKRIKRLEGAVFPS